MKVFRVRVNAGEVDRVRFERQTETLRQLLEGYQIRGPLRHFLTAWIEPPILDFHGKDPMIYRWRLVAELPKGEEHPAETWQIECELRAMFFAIAREDPDAAAGVFVGTMRSGLHRISHYAINGESRT